MGVATVWLMAPDFFGEARRMRKMDMEDGVGAPQKFASGRHVAELDPSECLLLDVQRQHMNEFRQHKADVDKLSTEAMPVLVKSRLEGALRPRLDPVVSPPSGAILLAQPCPLYSGPQSHYISCIPSRLQRQEITYSN